MCDFCNFLFGLICGLMGPVPRQHPLPAREIEICRRLKEVRLLTKWPRSFLAHSLGVHRSVLTRLELGRMPLRYSLAVQMLPWLNMSPLWLATGQGERHPFNYLPSSEDLGIGANALFSEVFDTHLTLGFQPKYASPIMQMMVDLQSPDKGSLRGSLRDIVADNIARWLDEIPDESLDAFVGEVRKLGQKALGGFKKDRWERVLHRRRNRRIVRLHKDKWAAEAQEAATARLKKREKECKEGLDTQPGIRHNTGVQTRIRSLRELVHRLKQITSAPGAKAALARKFGVTRQAVGQWLSGTSNPTAEATLQLLNWVEEAESEQKQNPGAALTTTGHKTQVRRSGYEKQTQVRKKR